jgi:hypothetical protein
MEDTILAKLATKKIMVVALIFFGAIIYNMFNFKKTLDVEFASVIPFDFQYGRPHQCHIRVNIRNNTKYRFEQVNFNILDLDIKVSANANTNARDINVIDVSTNENLDCVDAIDEINNNISTSKVSTCSVPSFAEGDCQKLVNVSTRLNTTILAATKIIQASGYRKQMGELKDALIDAKLDSSNFLPFDEDRYSKYRVLMDIIASAATTLSYSIEYIPHSIGDIRLIKQTNDFIEIQGAATVQTTFSKRKISQVYTARFPREGMPCTIAYEMSACNEIPVPRLMELTDAASADTNSEQWSEDLHDQKIEAKKLLGPYKQISGPFIQQIKSQGICEGNSQNSFKCSDNLEIETDPIDIEAHFDNKELSLSLMSQLKHGNSAKSGIYADVQLRNIADIDLSSMDANSSGAFRNVVLPLLSAFHVDPDSGIEAINKCRAKSEPQPAQKNWVTSEINGTRVQCLFYGPNFSNFGSLHLARITLFREVQ